MPFAVERRCWTVRLWRPYERRMASPSSFSRRLCVAAVTTAFVIGIVVGILLPLYVPSSSALALLPHSALANQALRGNAIIANGPWEGVVNDVEGSDDVLPGSENDPEKPRAGTPHGALSWPGVDTSSTLPSPSAKSPTSTLNSATKRREDGVLDTRIFSQKFKVAESDASRNRVRHGPADQPGFRAVAQDSRLIFSKKLPSLTDLLWRTSAASGKQLRKPGGKSSAISAPPTNASSTGHSYAAGVGQGFQAPSPVTPPPNGHPAGLPQITRPLRLPKQRLQSGNSWGRLGSQGTGPGENRSGFERKHSEQQQEVPLEALVDGVYWSERVERALPQGFSRKDMLDWTSFADNATVVKVAEGCGRMQNRLLVFDNGTKSCCRYRQNNDQIQGEIFSFYLAQLLGLRSLPPATLGLLHGHEGQWRTVRGQLTLAQWNEQKPVVMTKFVDELVPAHIPRHFRGDGPREQRRLHPVAEDLTGLKAEELQEVAQWSDLVIFDYLTANLDRVVNNMYNKQWNPDMMAAPAHNLAKVAKTGLLVFLDNESGLLHGYRLLDKYESYHKAMLEGLCVFRRSTARAVLTLHYAGDIGQRLKMALMESQPQMAEWLPLLPDKSVKILRDRLARVAQQILQCENVYMNTSSTTDSNRIGSQDDLYDSLTRPSVDSS